MIRELNKKEIEEIMLKIESYKKKDYYKNYFEQGEEENNPDKAFIIDDYYVDFTIYDGICYMGCLKLDENFKTKKYSFIDLKELLEEQLKHYKVIFQWCKKENKKVVKFHKYLAKKFKSKYFEDDKYSILGVFYEEFKRKN